MLPPFTTSEDFARQRQEREPWLDGLTWIAERHGLEGERFELLPGGSNVVFASRSWVVKLYAPPWRREFDAERLLLDAVEGRLGVSTPPLEAMGHLMGWGYVAMGRLPGVPAGEVWGRVPPRERVRLLTRLGEALARLHALRVPGLEALGPAWPDLLVAQQAGWLEGQRRQGASDAWLAQCAALLERALPALPAGPVVPTHADVTYEHLLLAEEADGWRITGLIDFADATPALPEYELLGPFTHWFPDDPAQQRALLDGYGWPKDARGAALGERFLALALLHRFVRVPHLARRLERDAAEDFARVLREAYPSLAD